MGGSTRIVLAMDQPDSVTVAVVVAPERTFFAELEYGPDANTKRLMKDFAGLGYPPSRPIVLDFRGVDFVNSDGFALLIRWWKESKAAGRRFGLCLSPALRRVFDSSRLDRVIPCFTSLSDAVSGLTEEALGPT